MSLCQDPPVAVVTTPPGARGGGGGDGVDVGPVPSPHVYGCGPSAHAATASTLRYFERGDAACLRDRGMAPDLRQDLHMMEQRQRVTTILQSEDFREDLESLIEERTRSGQDPSGLLALQQVADFMVGGVALGGAHGFHAGPSGPINDLPTGLLVGYAKGERLLRCKVAAFYRIADLNGWGASAHTNYVSARVNKEQEHFLVKPYGLLSNEVTASSLVKVTLQGTAVDPALGGAAVASGAFSLHAAVFAARPDARCAVTVCTPATATVSALRCGLLPLCREAVEASPVSYLDHVGGGMGQAQPQLLLLPPADLEELHRSLGPSNKVVVLRNKGLLAIGESVEEAFLNIHNAVRACEVQVQAMWGGRAVDNLLLLDPQRYRSRRGTATATAATATTATATAAGGGAVLPTWRRGQQEFEALMRMLDNMGHRTGYAYKHPVVHDRPRKRSEVEIPATVSAFAFDDDDDAGEGGGGEGGGDGGPGSGRHGRGRSQQQQLQLQRQRREKTRWLNSPNAYTRVEVPLHDAGAGRGGGGGGGGGGDVGGGGNARKKTTWMRAEEGQRASGTAIKIEDPNQFVPLHTDLREFRDKRNKIRDQNRQDTKTAGPKSQLLAGIDIDNPRPQIDASQLEAEALLPQPPNPFGQLSEEELRAYTRSVSRLQRGLPPEEEEDSTATVVEVVESSELTTPTHPAGTQPSQRADESSDTEAGGGGGGGKTSVVNGGGGGGADTTAAAAESPAAVMGGTAVAGDETAEKPGVGGGERADSASDTLSPDASPTKAAKKKKQKFRSLSFLKRKKEKVEA